MTKILLEILNSENRREIIWNRISDYGFAISCVPLYNTIPRLGVIFPNQEPKQRLGIRVTGIFTVAKTTIVVDGENDALGFRKGP